MSQNTEPSKKGGREIHCSEADRKERHLKEATIYKLPDFHEKQSTNTWSYTKNIKTIYS